MEKVLLNMKAISKTFGSVQALKEVSLDLYAGEVLALMGENGAGKSTLMNILSGSLQPTKGEIYLKGEKVRQENVLLKHCLILAVRCAGKCRKCRNADQLSRTQENIFMPIIRTEIWISDRCHMQLAVILLILAGL